MQQRKFLPGSEWLYFKVYTGVNTADSILRNEISLITTILKNKGLIDNWFFLRYLDPDFHLRIRIHLTESKHVGEVMTIFHQYLSPLVDNYEVSKIQIDTYNREIERYGSLLISDAETLFGIDSEFTLLLIRKFYELKNEDYRWQIALVMIDTLLSDFLYTIEQRSNLLNRLSLSFKNEFGFNEFNSKQFNVKFRENKNVIESVLDKNIDPNLSDLKAIITQRSLVNRSVTLEILNKIDMPSKSLDELLSSYIHMMLNRLFRSRNRIHELVLYDFMRRYYGSSLAKAKYQSTQNSIKVVS